VSLAAVPAIGPRSEQESRESHYFWSEIPFGKLRALVPLGTTGPERDFQSTTEILDL